jgi:hypothetical protein
VAAALALALAGCSSADTPSTASAGSSSFRDRITNLFASSPDADTKALAAATADPNQDCPVADIRSGASTLQINAGARDPAAGTLRYQGTIARLARECAVRGTSMTVRVGVQGRLVLGQAGTPGQLELPLRYAVVHEGPNPKTVLTKLYRIPVTVPEGQSNVPFVHITEEDLTFPVPARFELENYVVYVGFDPGAAKEPAPKQSRRSR